MQLQKLSIKNESSEKLSTWIETPDGIVKATVVMVHGFGTDKHETAHYFDDIGLALTANHYRVVRFDLSGYGKSEGRQEDGCYSKHSLDLQTILKFVKPKFQDPIYLFAQSMGCFVTALAQSVGVAKTLMTGIPNTDPDLIIQGVSKRFGARAGAKLAFDGVSLLPRSTGKIQKIGPQFWLDIKALSPIQEITNLAQKTNLLIIHWQNDEVIGSDGLEGYSAIPGLKTMWLPGNHSVTNHIERENFIKVMLDFYN